MPDVPVPARAEAGEQLDRLQDLLRLAREAGADAADAMLVAGTSVQVQRRLGRTEHTERSEGRDLGLRVFVGRRSAVVSSTAVDPAGFRQLADRALAMARVVPEDPYAGLAEEAAPPEAAALEMDDPDEPSLESLAARAAAAEDAARAVKGVTNSDGADAGWSRTQVWLATSAGFAGGYARTGHSVSATAVAGEGTGMQRDYDYSSAVHLVDLEGAEGIGRRAGERAVARLDPRRPRTAKIPVVYESRIAGGLVGHLAGAINGSGVARGTSFLRDRMGQQVLSSGLRVVDDPRRVRGLRSKPFDGEGVPTARRVLVDDGVLRTWVLDSRSARQLGLRTTGHASRGTGGPPSPSTTNLYMEPGTRTVAELMADIGEGLLVTELFGSGVNGLTGDYSRGAAGFMIRGGAVAEPVAEITIAGNLLDMFLHMTPADDLRLRRATDAPTIRVDGMVVAGA